MIRVTIIDNAKIIESVFAPANDMLMAWAQENEKNSGYCIFKKTAVSYAYRMKFIAVTIKYHIH